MGIMSKHYLKCERCGADQEVVTDFNDKMSAIIDANNVGNYNWKRTSSNRILCGECHKAYKQLAAQQDNEWRQFYKAHHERPKNSKDW